MRIVHLSDIHLSLENLFRLKDEVLKALLFDLSYYKPDLIVITGDLIDMGGKSLLSNPPYKDKGLSPFKIFEQEFINPLKNELNLDNSKFLFIPGNHDVDNEDINIDDELKLRDLLDDKDGKKDIYSNVSLIIEGEYESLNPINRLKEFKRFEQDFHKNTSDYEFSNYQSTYIYTDKETNYKIGFLLLNDSWRCSSSDFCFEKKYHFVGVPQFKKACDRFTAQSTVLNILLHHHPIDSYREQEEITEKYLSRTSTTEIFHLLLCGHLHSGVSKHNMSTISNYYFNQSRATLNKPLEQDQRYKPGYSIIDINLVSEKIERILYRVYEKDFRDGINRNAFVPDKETSRDPDGIFDNNNRGIDLTLIKNVQEVIQINIADIDLPKELFLSTNKIDEEN